MNIKKTLFLTVLFIGFSSMPVFSQTPAEYLCSKFEGTLSEVTEDRSFVGEQVLKCNIEAQWDMMIMSEINDMILNDGNFGSARDWQKTYVDFENYSRRSFSFDAGEYFIVNLYVPFEKKTNYFIIAQ